MTTSLEYASENGTTIIMDTRSCQTLGIHSLSSEWFESEYWQNNNAITGQASGRGSTLFVRWQDVDLIMRHYCRGGAIRHISKDKYVFGGLQRTRAWRELALLQHMNNLKLPVPQGVGARVQRDAFFYRADLLCLRIPHAKDIHQLLVSKPLATSIWKKIGSAIRQLHNAQVYHHDLNIRNIMLDSDEKVWIIDFDKCALKAGDKWKKGNLDRLHRSLLKEREKASQFHFDQREWQSLISGYSEYSEQFTAR